MIISTTIHEEQRKSRSSINYGSNTTTNTTLSDTTLVLLHHYNSTTTTGAYLSPCGRMSSRYRDRSQLLSHAADELYSRDHSMPIISRAN